MRILFSEEVVAGSRGPTTQVLHVSYNLKLCEYSDYGAY